MSVIGRVHVCSYSEDVCLRFVILMTDTRGVKCCVIIIIIIIIGPYVRCRALQ